MADEPEKHRTSPPHPLPADEQYTPGGVPEHDHDHGLEDEFAENLLFESNDYKLQHYRGAAQQMANDWGCSVLLHFYELPSYQRTNGTMMAAFIPADESKASAPPPPATQAKNKR